MLQDNASHRMPSDSQSHTDSAYPFTEFVLKIYERCNLACTYCYMYEMADQSWRSRPVKMSAEIFEQVSIRIAEHVERHELKQIQLVLHGGEPLLRGRDFIGWAVSHLRKQLKNTSVQARVQTNGVHLDTMMLRTLRTNDVFVGVSLDGTRSANDRYRLGPKGTSSFDATVAGIERLRQPEFRHLFRSLYATIDLQNDPIETYNFLLSFAPSSIDFLLPHSNWDTPPTRSVDSPHPYADWLIAVFEEWYGHSTETSIRLFHNIMVGLLGGQSEIETIGVAPVTTMFIDTDGTMNQLDALKSAFEGATNTGYDVVRNAFDDVMRHPGIRARQRGEAGLSETCRKCDLATVCGGGYYPHRYRADTGFDNPSVYCADLMALIQHIRSRVLIDLSTAHSQTHNARNHAILNNHQKKEATK